MFYRLNVVTLEVPPLRDRQNDIPLLAQRFMGHFAAKNRKRIKGFTPRAMDALIRHDWPGTVRELENAVERAVILLTADLISERELPLGIAAASGGDLPADGAPVDTTPTLAGLRSLEEIEKEAILATLSATGGNKSETARRLGINRKTLHTKLKRYGL